MNDFKFGWEACYGTVSARGIASICHRPIGSWIRFHCLERAPAGGIRLDLAWGGGSENRKIMLGTGVTCPILRYHTPP